MPAPAPQRRRRSARIALGAAMAFAPCIAFATAGYFQTGYGLKAKGMGGVGVAFPQDALVAATNPAGMVLVGNRIDVGLEQFDADRGSTITGNLMGLSGERDANGQRRFLIPELGFNRMMGEDWSLGVSAFGNGGMTHYRDNPLASLNGTSPAGMEFVQGNLASTLSIKLNENNVVGLSLNFVYQQMTARGMEHFDDPLFSAYSGSVTNRGTDDAWGIGWRVGWIGRLTPDVTLGAAYQPRTRMGKFGRYKGLLAAAGNFDVPENYVVGVAVMVTPTFAAVADIQQINYSDVPSLGNSAGCFLAVACLLGSATGPGSGWRDTTVFKIGVAWEADPRLVLRGGVTLLRQPIPSSQTLLNVFAPAVSERHVSLGATWKTTATAELTASFMHGFKNTVNGSGSIPAGFPPGGVGGGEADLRMKQRAIGIEWAWRY